LGSPYVILAICILAAFIFVLIVWQVSGYALRAIDNRHVIGSSRPVLLPLLLLLGPVIFLGLMVWRIHRRG
jgi:hypothetical protein